MKVYLILTKVGHRGGGGESFLLESMKWLHKEYQCIWVAFCNNELKDYIQDEIIDTEYGKLHKSSKGMNIENIKDLIKLYQPDIIHSQGNIVNIVKDIENIPLIVGFHFWNGIFKLSEKTFNSNIIDNIKDHKIDPLYLDLIDKKHTLYVASEFMTDVIKKFNEYHNTNIPIIENVIYPVSEKDRYFCEYDIDAPYVTMVNISVGKGGDILYNIMKELPEITFLCVRTEGFSDEYDGKIFGLKNCKWSKHVEKTSDIYKMSRVVLLPNHVDETFCRVAYETANIGIPIITTGKRYISDMLGDACITVSETDIKQWVKVISRLYNSKKLREEYSKKLIKVTSRFSEDKEKDKFIKLVENSILNHFVLSNNKVIITDNTKSIDTITTNIDKSTNGVNETTNVVSNTSTSNDVKDTTNVVNHTNGVDMSKNVEPVKLDELVKKNEDITKLDELIKESMEKINIVKTIDYSKGKNIMIFCPWGDTGLGILSRIYSKILMKNGWNVFIFSFIPYVWEGKDKPEQKDPNEWLGYTEIYYSKNVREKVTDDELKEFIKKYSISICILPEICWYRVFEIADLMKVLKVKCIAIPMLEIIKKSELKNFSKFHKILCVTKICHYMLESEYYVPNCYYIGHGFNGVEIKEKPDIKKGLKFLHISGLNSIQRKNTLKLCEAFKLALEKTKDIYLTITLEGNIPKEVYQYKCDNINIIDTHLSHKDILDLHNYHHCVIHVSVSEGLGMGFCEAMSMSTSIISLYASPHNEFVNVGKTGWLIECQFKKMEDNKDGLVHAAVFNNEDLLNIILFLEKNRDKVVQMNKSVKEVYLKNWTEDILEKRLIPLLN